MLYCVPFDEFNLHTEFVVYIVVSEFSETDSDRLQGTHTVTESYRNDCSVLHLVLGMSRDLTVRISHSPAAASMHQLALFGDAFSCWILALYPYNVCDTHIVGDT